MKTVYRILLLVVVLATVSSCGIFKKTKHKEKHEIEEIVKRDSSVMESSTHIGEVKEKEIDKGKVVTDRTTTTVTEKSGSTKVVVGKDDLKPGLNYLKDSAGNVVKAILDTVSKTLTLDISTNEKTTTTTNERITEDKDVTKEREEKKQETNEKQVAVTGETRREEKHAVSDPKKEPSTTGILSNFIGWAVFVIAVLAFVLWYFGIKRKK